MGARADAVVETRERVVTAARALLLEEDFHRVTMEEVGRRADVSRATVYHQFTSKLGLVEAVITDLEARAGLAGLVAVVEEAEPRELVRAVVLAGCGYWSTDPQLARKAIGLAAVQAEVGELLARHDAGRRAILARVVERLVEGGALHDGCPPDQALQVLWLLTSFDAYDLLVRGQGLEHDDAAALLATLAEDQLHPR